MGEKCRAVAVEKIKEMPIKQVITLLIFMAGMEAERSAEKNAGRITAVPCENG